MAVPAGGGRVQVALDETGPWVWAPAWTSLDQHPNLVASFTVDRGRVYELDQTDGGRATVTVIDPDGILDPTNLLSPYFGKIEPLVQCRLRSWDPMAAAWEDRFRGWVSDWNYEYDPSQRLGRATVELVDMFEMLGGVEMVADLFGDPSPPAESLGQVWFPAQTMEDRINTILDQTGVPTEFRVVFSGNVSLAPAVYSPGEHPLTAIQEAVDAEFPGVGNVYVDRHGRLSAHGRYARFDPAAVIASPGGDAWDFHHFSVGDLAAVQDELGQVAQLRRFSFNRGVSKIINSALAYPQWFNTGTGYEPITDDDIVLQWVKDDTSIGRYGIRSWSAQNLQTDVGLLDSAAALVETKRFAEYYVSNYAQPRNRVETIGFDSIRPGRDGSQITWRLLTEIDVSDQVDVTVSGSNDNGGMGHEPHYVEGVHETVEPLNPDHDLITVSLDLSPAAYYTTNPFPTPP